ncbi:hypothetical protein KO361_02870 [Candidatus Woesearchaeota archaeon]|nr:hypothetical protein [Candidatus Woesearchaeota archaeon]
MKSKKTGLFFSLMVVAVLSLAIMVTAHKGNFEERGFEYSEERCDEMMGAFNELDYEAWKELMTMNGRSSRVLSVVNEDNFHLFVEAHEAKKSGDYELAKQIREELGLFDGEKSMNGAGFGKSNGFGEMKGQGRGVHGVQQFKNKK